MVFMTGRDRTPDENIPSIVLISSTYIFTRMLMLEVVITVPCRDELKFIPVSMTGRDRTPDVNVPSIMCVSCTHIFARVFMQQIIIS